jgi:hypothetical protein
MTLADELQGIAPRVGRSPWPDHEYVRGFGVFAMPFSSGHVLALRVFPENDFAPYVTVWHRDPAGDWSIFVDGPRVETACPRYYGPATRHIHAARITRQWAGPAALRVEMDAPRLVWTMTIAAPLPLRVMNVVSARLPLASWRPPALLRAREWIARRLLGMGDIRLSGTMPSGHVGILMPQRIYFIAAASAVLDGRDLGAPVRVPENPTIGEVTLPARPTFAIGQAHWRIVDHAEYERQRDLSRAALAPTWAANGIAAVEAPRR